MIKAYRTLSRDAVRVIGGIIPLDLVVDRRWVTTRVRLFGEHTWEGRKYTLVGLIKGLQRGIIEVWQEIGKRAPSVDGLQGGGTLFRRQWRRAGFSPSTTSRSF
jgi:hypothetical protein